MEKKYLYILRNVLAIGSLVLLLPITLFSATETELRNQIAENLKKQAELEEQIIQYSKLYSSTSKEAQSLQKALKELELSQKKLQADLSYTTKKIENATLSIEELSGKIGEAAKVIKTNSEALRSSLVSLALSEGDTTVERFLGHDSISEAWDDITLLSRYQSNISNLLSDQKDLKYDLETNKTRLENEKKNLVTYKKQLDDQKNVVEYSQKEKDKLLKDTRSKETTYKAILEEKQKQKDAFEQELYSYESALRILFDPTSVPEERSGVLSWPLSDVFITQLFGKTSSSKRLYVSGTHNGIDFRAALGTKVSTALSGTVWGTGDTDLYPGCYSYGRWVLVKHGNGLSSLYAHLSKISVSIGDTVLTGDTIGYSGNTGYSTGPHLHFGLYATAGTRVEKYSASKYCKEALMPLADPKAYLDPRAYLPAR